MEDDGQGQGGDREICKMKEWEKNLYALELIRKSVLKNLYNGLRWSACMNDGGVCRSKKLVGG